MYADRKQRLTLTPDFCSTRLKSVKPTVLLACRVEIVRACTTCDEMRLCTTVGALHLWACFPDAAARRTDCCCHKDWCRMPTCCSIDRIIRNTAVAEELLL